MQQCVTNLSMEALPSGKGGFCDPVELPLLRRLLSLFTDRLDRNFLCILCDTGVDGCFLGCSVIGVAVAAPEPGRDPPVAFVLMVAPQEHVRMACDPPGWIPLPLLSTGVPAVLWWKPFWSLAVSSSAVSVGTGLDSDWGWAGQKRKDISSTVFK